MPEAYGPLLTDLYQITMAYGYWRTGKAAEHACFHLTFRENPFGGGYCLACGLEAALAFLDSFRFSEGDLTYLAGLTSADGSRLLPADFLGWLGEMRFTCDVDAVPEGTVVFPREPLVRVTGPIAQCQLVETALLNAVNFQSLVATKASRVVSAAQGDPVVEFGLRRAQGPDGGLSASRSAYVGGCVATSDVLAGKRFGIPVRGTHAHSWVMAFGDELEAFRAYAEALPANCVFLVDTYDTLQGVRNAVTVGRELRERGHEMLGVRIDSGDLAWLSARAREILAEGGFPDAVVMASNELDEHVITSLKDQGAEVGAWGVGTRLATAWDQPALGGVYKLSAMRLPDGTWEPRLKVTDQIGKVSDPGVLGVRRYSREDGEFAGDMIHDIHTAPEGEATMVDPLDTTRRRTFEEDMAAEELLVPVVRGGERVYAGPALPEVRARALDQLARLAPGVKRFLNPHAYPVGLERGLASLKTRLVVKARRGSEGRSQG